MLAGVLDGWKPVVVNDELKPYHVRRDELSTEGGCVLWGNRVIVPGSLRKNVLLELHGVHTGMSRMKALARGYVWWPGMDQEIESMVRGCETCQKNQALPAGASVHPWEYHLNPWERIHVDLQDQPG